MSKQLLKEVFVLIAMLMVREKIYKLTDQECKVLIVVTIHSLELLQTQRIIYSIVANSG